MTSTKVKVPAEPFPPFQVGDYACKGGRENLIGKGSFADVFKVNTLHNTKCDIRINTFLQNLRYQFHHFKGPPLRYYCYS